MDCSIAGGFAFAAGKFLFGLACGVGTIILITLVVIALDRLGRK